MTDNKTGSPENLSKPTDKANDKTTTNPNRPFRVMTGIRATGQLHIGHYFGSIKNVLELQKQYQCYFGIMDWHGMTTAYKSSPEVPKWSREIFADLVAWGFDHEKHTMFIQSAVPEHLDLFMIFANLTPMGWLERVPTWKDAEEEAKASDTHNLGRFAYPVLQAADIAIYKGEKVPVGQDQVAHLELTREIIRRFNHLYKGKIPEPAVLLTETPLVPGLDGRKMSKSYGNGLDLMEEEKSLAKKIKAAPTDPQRVRREDPGNPDVCNMYTYHKLFSSSADLQWVNEGCRSAGIGCGDCKARLIENINSLCKEPREKKKELLNNPERLDSMIRAGNEKARAEAQKNLKQFKEWMKL
jgi:tryptophanyl-tRNA synthetase